MKTLKVEAVYLTEYGTCEDLGASLPRFIEDVYNSKRRHSALQKVSSVFYSKNDRVWASCASRSSGSKRKGADG
jgi:hypothetical protein